MTSPLRLHLAEEPRKKSLPEVEAALAYWRRMNDRSDTWASFEAIQFTNDLVIRVKVGSIYYKGTVLERKEAAISTRSFFSSNNNNEVVSYHDSIHY